MSCIDFDSTIMRSSSILSTSPTPMSAVVQVMAAVSVMSASRLEVSTPTASSTRSKPNRPVMAMLRCEVSPVANDAVEARSISTDVYGGPSDGSRK